MIMDVKLKDIIAGAVALLLALLYFKKFDERLTFIWIGVSLAIMGLGPLLPPGSWIAFFALFTMGIGFIQAIRRKDKFYGIMMAAIIALLIERWL